MCLICDRIEMIKFGTNPYFVKELETGYVVLGDHQHFRGYTLFLCKRHETELFHLEHDFATKYMQEMMLVAAAVKKAFGAEKMNYELLGNGDTHLHWHLFPRNTGDIGEYGNQGKGPVWWYPREMMYADENRLSAREMEAMKKKLRRELEYMEEAYYKPCRELDICNELIEKYFQTQQYDKCFEGHMVLAQQGYPLAECQIGYFYYDGLGVEKDLEKAVYWTRRAADHGDRDGEFNLAWFHEDGIGVERDLEQASFWYRKAALQDHDLATQKCKELGVDLNATTIDREAVRKALQCRIYPLGYLERYKYTVICASFNGKWILSKHKKRNTWETQGGHIEDGETPLECARRELFEESGIRDADLYPVCDYWGFNSQACSNGMVFLAVAHSLGELPESEMKEIKIFDTLPRELTYPQTSPKLYAEAEKLLKEITKNGFQIRGVRADDAMALATVQTESWKSAFRGILDHEDLVRLTNVEKATNMYCRLLNEGKGHGYIGELDGKAHCIAWWDSSRDADMPGYAEIICIHSLPDNWRKGYGSQMMDRLLADMKAAGYQKVMLWVFTDNHRARAFYEAKGFVATEKVKPALGTTEICYIKEL